MNILSHTLSQIVAQVARDSVAEAIRYETPDMVTTTMRLPGAVRQTYDLLANKLGISLQQTMLLTLRSVVENEQHPPETTLLALRVQQAFALYGVHAIDASSIHPSLSPESLHDTSALLRNINRDIIKEIADKFSLNWQWLSGIDHQTPDFGNWYNNPHEPIKWAKDSKKPTMIAYVVRVEGAKWDKKVPLDDYNHPLSQNQMALILHHYENIGEINYPIYHMWRFERISDSRIRTIARIILSRLRDIDIQLRGITISEDLYSMFCKGVIFPIELVKNDLQSHRWSVEPLLYKSNGPYTDEDKFFKMEAWAGGEEFSLD